MVDSAIEERWLLAIDTSTEQAGLALTNGNQISELSWLAGRDQTVTVLAQIDHLLTLSGIEAAAINAIGIAVGPGMFNGLRVGMSLAKGFHFGLGADLIGVSTFEITAYPFAKLGVEIASVVAAGRGRLVWQFVPAASSPVNGTIDELVGVLSARTGRVVVAGDLTAEQAARLAIVPGAVIPESAVRRRKPGALAEIAWARWSDRAIDDPIALAPVYFHAATTPGRG
jgi:tRNA threonylcarbamoyladenosine biosynthesis protein TsaB